MSPEAGKHPLLLMPWKDAELHSHRSSVGTVEQPQPTPVAASTAAGYIQIEVLVQQ